MVAQLVSPVAPPRSGVLIVDASDDAREVLRTALERRGLHILEADDARQGLAFAKEHRPEVIVLDGDAPDANDERVSAEYQREAAQGAAVIVLGRASRVAAGSDEAQVIAKPYHYGPLIRTIEQLAGRAVAAS